MEKSESQTWSKMLSTMKTVKNREQCTYAYLLYGVEPGKLTFFLAMFVTQAAKNFPCFYVLL